MRLRFFFNSYNYLIKFTLYTNYSWTQQNIEQIEWQITNLFTTLDAAAIAAGSVPYTTKSSHSWTHTNCDNLLQPGLGVAPLTFEGQIFNWNCTNKLNGAYKILINALLIINVWRGTLRDAGRALRVKKWNCQCIVTVQTYIAAPRSAIATTPDAADSRVGVHKLQATMRRLLVC